MRSKSALRTVSDPASLHAAWRAISKRNKLSKGIDKVTIKSFASNLDSHIKSIGIDLRSGNYEFSKLKPGTVVKPGSKKRRPIQIPTVSDRVVMKALALHIQPTFARFDLPCSFAFIAGMERGVKAAIRRVHDLVGEGYVHYFEADIINFFGTVNRSRLWGMFAKQIRERSLLPLLEKCFNLELADLESYQLEHQDIFLGVTEGIPQGGVLSPLLANFYLYEFDKALTEAGFKLVRYADDFVVMCKTREDADRAHNLCRKALKGLGLEIHALDAPNTKSRFGYFNKDGLAFLGVRFEGQITYPQSKVVDRFKTKLHEILKPGSGDSLSKTLQKLSNLICGWGNGYKEMKVNNIYINLDAYIKAQVENYLKSAGVYLKGRNRRSQMKFLGIPSLSAMVAHTTNTEHLKSPLRPPAARS